ncbi:MAG: hypothetical protein MHM6MM_001279 [Cercozoa sp. M6MM]
MRDKDEWQLSGDYPGEHGEMRDVLGEDSSRDQSRSVSSDEVWESAIGTDENRFIVQVRLGAGSFGQVWAAHRVKQRRDYMGLTTLRVVPMDVPAGCGLSFELQPSGSYSGSAGISSGGTTKTVTASSGEQPVGPLRLWKTALKIELTEDSGPTAHSQLRTEWHLYSRMWRKPQLALGALPRVLAYEEHVPANRIPAKVMRHYRAPSHRRSSATPKSVTARLLALEEMGCSLENVCEYRRRERKRQEERLPDSELATLQSKYNEDEGELIPRGMPLHVVARIGARIMRLVQVVHDAGCVVHRDVKPDNFVLPRGCKAEMSDEELLLSIPRMCIVDFGLARDWQDTQSGDHVPLLEGRRLSGTPRYASLWAHSGMRQARRDDLVALGYGLIYMLLGRLPWQGRGARAGDDGCYGLIRELKQKYRPTVLCKHLPSVFCEFLDLAYQIKYSERPAYAEFENMLLQFATKYEREQKLRSIGRSGTAPLPRHLPLGQLETSLDLEPMEEENSDDEESENGHRSQQQAQLAQRRSSLLRRQTQSPLLVTTARKDDRAPLTPRPSPQPRNASAPPATFMAGEIPATPSPVRASNVRRVTLTTAKKHKKPPKLHAQQASHEWVSNKKNRLSLRADHDPAVRVRARYIC